MHFADPKAKEEVDQYFNDNFWLDHYKENITPFCFSRVSALGLAQERERRDNKPNDCLQNAQRNRVSLSLSLITIQNDAPLIIIEFFHQQHPHKLCNEASDPITSNMPSISMSR